MAGGVRSGNSCGAFNSGLMAIASVTGRSPENMTDKQAVADTLALGRKLFDKFMEEYRTVICRDIQYKIKVTECTTLKICGASLQTVAMMTNVPMLWQRPQYGWQKFWKKPASENSNNINKQTVPGMVIYRELLFIR